MGFKQELVIYADMMLVGTFCKWIEKSSEKNYVYLQYTPLNSLKKRVLEKAIHKDNIHIIHASSDIPGVEKRTIFIKTGEQGSLIENALNSDAEQTIRDLREKIRRLQMQVASSKQSEEDARSGVNKVISSMKGVSRSSSPFEQRFPSPTSPPHEYSGFDDF